MKFKTGVIVKGIQKETIVAICVADKVYANHGQELVVTSVMDGKHKKGSLHYKGLALDSRTWYFSQEAQIAVVAELKAELGQDYDVVLEPDHIHIEYDPK